MTWVRRRIELVLEGEKEEFLNRAEFCIAMFLANVRLLQFLHA